MERLFPYGLVFIFLYAVISTVLLLPATSTHDSRAEDSEDTLITSEVKTKLAADKVQALSRIEAETNQRIVYLRGTAQNPLIKARATEAALQVRGVQVIVNNVEVQNR